MATSNNPDPYNGFKQDDQRRRALNVHAICQAASNACKALACVAIAYALADAGNPKAVLAWLRHILL